MRIKPVYLIVVAFLFSLLLAYFNTFEKPEYLVQDGLFQNKADIDTRVVIIAIDEDSLEKLGRWPWSRAYHAQLINTLAKGDPAAVFLDITLSEPAQDPEEDRQLAEAMEKFGRVIVPVYGVMDPTAKEGSITASQLSEPVPVLKKASLQAHINTFQDSDGIIRKTLLHLNYKGEKIESAALKAYKTYMEVTGGRDISESIPLDSWNRMYIHYSGAPEDIEHHSYYQVLNGEIPPEYFEDKIVLVGPYTVGMGDHYLTPADRQVPMYGVEIHGNIIHNLLYGNFKQEVNFMITAGILAILGILGIFTFNRMPPGWSAALLVLVSVVYIVAARQFYKMGFIVSIIYPLLFYFAVYLIMLAYRYIDELMKRKHVTAVFGRYVAPQIVNKIMEEGEDALQLGGARREISALFVDIRGFTPLSEKVQPEEVVGILNEYLTLCAQSIFEYEGTLDKFIGDAAMALFNAPLDLEEHAFRAVQAAWAMKQGAIPLQKKLEEKFGHFIQFGIGINTGEAVVGNIGAAFRMDYTAIGDTVNTAARLESNAKPGQILMSQSTYDRVKDRVDATYMGEYTVKGKTLGIPVYQLDGLK